MAKSKQAIQKQDYRQVLQNFVSSPAVKYVAGGIATAVLHRFATNLSTRYPEITRVLKENLDFIESKLTEYSTGFGKDSEQDPMKVSH
jgi:hypothetical protein